MKRRILGITKINGNKLEFEIDTGAKQKFLKL